MKTITKLPLFFLMFFLLLGCLNATEVEAKSVTWNSGNLFPFSDWTNALYAEDPSGQRQFSDFTVSVSYHVTLVNADSGLPILEGSSVPVGTRLHVAQVTPLDDHISWNGTGYDGDSPYGRWVVNAARPNDVCASENFVGWGGWGEYNGSGDKALYNTISVNPPSSAVTSISGNLISEGTGVYRVTSSGPVSVSFGVNSTYAHVYGAYRYLVFDGTTYQFSPSYPCTINPGVFGHPEIGFVWGRYNVGIVQSPYTLTVPQQTITFNLTAVAGNNPPTAPTVTPQPFSGTISTAYPWTAVATDPDGDQIYYEFDWNNNMSPDQSTPTVNSGISQSLNNPVGQWSSPATFSFKVRAVDTRGGTSAWTTAQVTVVAPTNCGTATDTDGNVYNSVVIGTQCWLKENMRVGTMINTATLPTDNGVIEKNCYNNNLANCTTNHPNYPDGGLYTWNEAMQYSTTEGAQGICPIGWHIPTDAEWHVLENYLKDSGQTCDPNRTGYDCVTAGDKLKAVGVSGFEGNFGGNIWWITGSQLRDSTASFHTSSEISSITVLGRGLNTSFTGVSRGAPYNKNWAFSVRCIQGAGATPPPQCSDGVDNDSDGKTDYPNDLGCADANDDDETDPLPPAATITASDCIIAQGSGSCDSTITWSSTALSAPSVRQDGIQFSTSASSTLNRIVVGEGGHLFSVYDTGVEYASSTMAATCTSGTTWDGDSCEPTTCPGGTIWDGDSCEPLVVSPLTCSDDTTTISDTAQAWTGSWYGTPQAVMKVGNYLFAGASGLDSTQGLYIYDISDPANISQQSFFSTYSPASVQNNSWGNDVLGLDVEGGYAYLATYYGGLVIVNVSNPAAPSFVGKIPLYTLNPPGNHEVWDVEVIGNYAYLAAGKGLIVVDVGSKASPAVVANLDLGASISQDIIVSGNYAYIAMRDHGFSVVDITNPASPVERSHVTAGYNGSSMAYGLEKKGDILYVADHFAERVSYYNVVNPSAPVLVGSVPAQNPTGFDSPRELHIAGDVMYVSAGRGGLYVYDVTNPAAPVELFSVLKPPLPATAKVWGVVPLDPNDFTELAIISDDVISNIGVYTTKTNCTPLADLTSSFSISGTFSQNVAIPLSATVSNVGSGVAGPFSDNFSYSWDGTNWSDITPFIAHAALGVGASEPDTSSFTPNVSGTLWLQHCVDSYHQIDEGTNETPNCVQQSVMVNPPAQCPAGETLSWTVGSDSCSADTASPKNSGESLTVLDAVADPATGQAAFDCRNDGTWDPAPTAATCALPPPPSTPIGVDVSVDRELVRVGETADMTIDVNIGVRATCTVYGVNLTPFTFLHSGVPAAQLYTYTTRALSATQIVTVSCVSDPVVAGVVAGRDEQRIEVVPEIQER